MVSTIKTKCRTAYRTATRGVLSESCATFSLVCFLGLKESTWETRKNAFYFTFSRKSNFRILDIQIP